MEIKRKSGVLLHISSLPGKYGIGDLGQEVYDFVDNLTANGFSIWQILPVNPTGSGNSPYQAYSAYAGEPLFISIDKLKEWNLLSDNDLLGFPAFDSCKVDFDELKPVKYELLNIAWNNFSQTADETFQNEFSRFKDEHNWWLNDYAIYTVCKKEFDGKPWNKWSEGMAKRNPQAIENFVINHFNKVEEVKFIQFIFFRQWFQLKEYANNKGIEIFGDLPLYVSHDSSDVWGNQHLFILKEDGEPELVGGVPPDYFCEDGQLWGNPLFDWDKLAETNYQWWISRLYFNFHMFNLVRIDHFRGLESYWSVPGDSDTAKTGWWVPAKGYEMLSLLQSQLGDLPVIAEDLGIITDEVKQLRDHFQLPGMKVLQFAFLGNPAEVHLPHNFSGRNVVYTGTHDNNTLVGWIDDMEDKEKAFVSKFFAPGVNVAQEMIRLAWSSTAELAIIPMQDIIQLDGNSRMNTPGNPTGNWTWRYKNTQLKACHWEFVKELNTIYNRSSKNG